MFDGFVNPALAFGAALAAVPLLIHLLNRQRHKPLPWAAMRFVIAAYRRTRRRARLENLLLLLLRMAAVALLAFAVARPFIGEGSPLAALTESRRDVVLVLDGSASTGYRQEVRTVFEGIVERAREVVLGLESSRGDRVRLVLAGRYPRLLSWRSPEEALSLLGTLTEPTDETLDLAAAMGEVARWAEEDAAGTARSALEVRLFTDLQRRSFTPSPAPSDADAAGGAGPERDPAAQGRAVLAEELDRLQALSVRVLVEDLGPAAPRPPNLGVAAVELEGPLVAPGTPAEVAVSVRNFGAQARSGVRVVLEVDGDRRPSQLVDVPARGEARAVFSVVFRASGDHVLRAGVESDRLAVDDARVQVVHVPPPVRVLLVNGEPELEIERDETGYLAAVLEPPRGDSPLGETPPFDVRVLEPHALRDASLDLESFDVIVLANVSSLAEGTVERLEQRVAAGAGLIVTMGKQIAVDAWNLRMHRPDGTGLLPASLGARVAVPDRRRSYFRVKDFQVDHPALAFFADERWRPLLTEVPVYEFLSARPLEGTARPPRVLARLDDEASSPLLVEREYDRGVVYLWLTTIDPEWTRLPESPRTLVPLAHELVRHAALPAAPSRNLAVGGGLAAEVEGFPRSVFLVSPDGSRRALEGEPQPAGSAWRLPLVSDTDRAGAYRLEVDGAANVPFAVQIDPREGDLERLGANELSAVHPALEAVRAGAGESGSEGDPGARKGEVWRALAIACFAALFLETLWAAWIGRRRRLP